jgi:hypothetical protein
MYCLFCVVPALFMCTCVLNNCHRVATQLQLNISYHIIPDIKQMRAGGVSQTVKEKRHILLNPYPANVENMVSS